MTKTRIITNLMIFIILTFATMASLAHVPYFAPQSLSFDNPFQIKTELSTSVALYGALREADDVAVFRFEVEPKDFDEAGFMRLHVGMLVPRCSSYVNYTPELVLIGPPQESLPIALRADQFDPSSTLSFEFGGIWVTDQLILEQREESTFYEEYTKKWYWHDASKDVRVEVAGTYYLIIYDPNKQIGAYVLEFGDVEVWKTPQITRAATAMPKLLMNLEIPDRSCRKEVRYHAPID